MQVHIHPVKLKLLCVYKKAKVADKLLNNTTEVVGDVKHQLKFIHSLVCLYKLTLVIVICV